MVQRNKENVITEVLQDAPRRPPKPKERILQTRREYCPKCIRSTEVCLCPDLPSIETDVTIGILQHPAERKKTFNTARPTHLSLNNSFFYYGVCFDDSAELKSKLNTYAPGEAGILFPSPNSAPISRPLEEAPDNLKCLIALDASWSLAKKMRNQSQILLDLPHYHFTPPEVSRYTFRREPKKNFVCTLEAIIYSLRILEPQNKNVENLWKVLESIVELQTRHEREEEFKNCRHRTHYEERIYRKRIKELKWALFSSKNPAEERQKLFEELLNLEQKLSGTEITATLKSSNFF